jgi:plasmid stability protein
MADVLVRGIAQDVIERLEEKARRSGRSLDDLAREVLTREATPTRAPVQTRAEILADLDRIRLSGPRVSDDSTLLVRAARDGDDVGH